jgi:hypothetical protein
LMGFAVSDIVAARLATLALVRRDRHVTTSGR